MNLNVSNLKNKFINILSTKLFFIILIIILIWRILKNNIILIAGILYLWYIYHGQFSSRYNEIEKFNYLTNEFVPLGHPRFDLMGVKLRTRPIDWSFWKRTCVPSCNCKL